MPALRNALIVIADCLRADAVPEELKAGAVYANAWACGSATIPAFASLFTGRLPHEHGAVTRYVAPTGTYLPQHFPDHNALVVTQNPLTRWCGQSVKIRDKGGVRYILENVPPTPWLIFFHAMTTHFPYGGEGLEHKMSYKTGNPVGLEPLRQHYHASVAKFAEELLELEHQLKPDVSILTADHGDGFLEHGFFGHPGGRMFPELLHVPLYIRDGKRKYTYRHPFSMVYFPYLVVAAVSLGKRVSPTPNEECYSSGYRSGRPRVAAIRKGNSLTINSAVARPLRYDLEKDPGAQEILLPDITTMPKLIEAEQGQAEAVLGAQEEAELTERLEALGYL